MGCDFRRVLSSRGEYFSHVSDSARIPEQAISEHAPTDPVILLIFFRRETDDSVLPYAYTKLFPETCECICNFGIEYRYVCMLE